MTCKKMHIGLCGLLAVAAGTQWAWFSAHSNVGPLPHYPEVVRAFAQRFPAAHLLQIPLNERISAQAWTNYLASLDFDRSYFTQADLDGFEPYRLSIGDRLQAGDTTFAFEAFRLFKDRLDERYRFVTNSIAQGFDFSIDETYETKRQALPWPLDREAQDDLWRRRIKNEYLGRKLAQEIETAAAGVEPPDTEAEPSAVSHADDEGIDPTLAPDAFVVRRYSQFRTVIMDSDAEWVMQRYMSAIASAFDPHSSYMSPATLEDFNIDMTLSLVGIGALLRPEDGAAKIVSLIAGGPAERDRSENALRPGDKIIGVGQGDGPIKDVLHLPLYRTVRKIRGELGTRVVLLVIPASDPTGATTKTVELIREEVKLEDQAASSRTTTVPDGEGRERLLGIVRLPAFYASMQNRDVEADGFRSATHDVSQALAALNEKKVEGLLLDLRNNSGGSLREAIEMTGLFIRTGPVVQVREARAIHVLTDRDPAVAFRLPMVILLNRLSASASEILAGALQDYGRALIVGDAATHGKGSVQTIMPLGANEGLGSIKVTTANYYRIGGGSTQLRGIVPDIVVPSVYDAMDLGERRLPNAMPWTQVPPAAYQPLADLGLIAEQLRGRSEQRRADSESFARYQQLVEHVRDLNSRTSVPLEWEARQKLMRSEHEVRRAETRMAEDRDVTENGDDPILNEAVHILAELVQIQGPIEALEAHTNDSLHEMMRRIFGR